MFTVYIAYYYSAITFFYHSLCYTGRLLKIIGRKQHAEFKIDVKSGVL